MKTIFTKIVDTIYEKSKKIPDVLMVVLFFVLLFQKQAKRIVEIIDRLSQSLLPDSFIDLVNNFNITSEEIYIVWEFLIIFTGMFTLWHIAKQFFNSDFRGNLDTGDSFLLHLNSVILICIIIYNKVSDTPIYFDAYADNMTHFSLYHVIFCMSLAIFVLFFGVAYLQIFLEAFIKIKKSPKKRWVKIVLYIIGIGILGWLLNSMHQTLFLNKV